MNTIDAISPSAQKIIDAQAQTIAAQAAEIERLLKALNEIDDIFDACDDQQDAYAELARCGRIASKALRPQEAENV